MFLTIDDYKAVCDDFEFENLQANTEIRQQAEAAAFEQISSYTRDRYDMAKAFSKEGRHRNPMLVQVAVNVSLYIMVHRLPQGMGSDRREQLYDDAIKWLRDVQASKASPDLPKYTSPTGDTDAHNPVRFGSAINKVKDCTW